MWIWRAKFPRSRSFGLYAWAVTRRPRSHDDGWNWLITASVGFVGTRLVRSVMDDAPLTCTPETEIDEVRRMMLQRHARYMPVLERRTLMGVISFYDVAKTVVDAQDFENRMLKAYIRDWPADQGEPSTSQPGA